MNPDLIPWGALMVLVTGTLIPAAASWLTHSRWPSYMIGLLTVVLSAVSGFAGQLADNGGPDNFDFKQALLTSLGALFAAAIAYTTTWAGHYTEKFHTASGVGARPRPT